MKLTSRLTKPTPPMFVRGEPKIFGIRRATKPMVHPAFAGVVRVFDQCHQQGYCYIKFNEQMPIRLGKKMPKGISTAYPAYFRVHVERRPDTKEIVARKVFCAYLREDERRLCWVYTGHEAPAWLLHVREAVAT